MTLTFAGVAPTVDHPLSQVAGSPPPKRGL